MTPPHCRLVSKNMLRESWLMHLKHHDVPPPQAIEAMERFV